MASRAADRLQAELCTAGNNHSNRQLQTSRPTPDFDPSPLFPGLDASGIPHQVAKPRDIGD